MEISTINTPPPSFLTVILSLVTLPNTKTHETEVRSRGFWITLIDSLFRLSVLLILFINNFPLMVLHQNILIKIILSVNKDEFQWRKCLFDFHLALTKTNDCILPPSLAKAAESRAELEPV
jgi:hypothetical protein